MKNVILSASILALAAMTSAQSGGSLTTVTPVGVFARTGTALDFKYVKANTAFKSLNVNAKTSGAEAITCVMVPGTGQSMCAGGGMHSGGMCPSGGMHTGGMGGMGHKGHAGGMMMHEECKGQAGVHIAEMGSSSNGGSSAGTSASNSAASVKQGPHSIQLLVPGKLGAKGTLQVRWMSHASGGGKVSGAIDVNGDGKPDFTGTEKDMMLLKSLDVTAGASGFVFKITTDGSTPTSTPENSNYCGRLHLCFTPKGNDGNALGSIPGGCGLELRGSMVSNSGTHLLEVNLRTATPNAVGALVIGDKRVDLPLPGTTCLLHTNLLAYVLFRTDAFGQASQRFTLVLPSRPKGFLQDVVSGNTGLAFKTSNLLRVE